MATGSKSTRGRTSGRSGYGKYSSKGSTSRKKSTATRSNKKREAEIIDEVILLFVFAVAVLLFLSNLKLIGAFGKAVSGVMFGLMGVVSYIFPIAFFLVALYYVAGRGDSSMSVKIGSMFVLMFVLSTLGYFWFKIDNAMDSANALDYYSLCRDSRSGGGLFGTAIGQTLVKIIGKVGAYIVLFVLAIISVIIISEKSILRALGNGTRNLTERTGRHISDYREARSINAEDRMKVRESEREAQLEARNRRLEAKEKRNEERLAERELKRNEAIVDRALKRERRLEDVRKKEEELGQYKQRRMEMKVSGVSTDTIMTNEQADNDVYVEQEIKGDDLHEINVDTEGFDYSNITVKNEHAISINSNELPEMLSGYTLGPSALTRQESISSFEEVSYNPQEMRNRFSGFNAGMNNAPENNRSFEEFKPYVPEGYDNKTVAYDRSFEKPDYSFENAEEECSKTEFEDEVLSAFSGRQHNKTEINEGKTSDNKAEDRNENTGSASRSVQKPKASIDSTSARKPLPQFERKSGGNYEYPPIDLLEKGSGNVSSDSNAQLSATANKLQETLKTFGVNVTMTQWSQGPTVTRFEMQPQQGVKVRKILDLADDIKLNMAVTDVRIEAPIPGKAAIGIEVPNKTNSVVNFRDLIESSEFKNSQSKLSFAVGKDIEGKTVVTDIAKMPHLLIAGATGSGKSVCINTLIMSILYKASPDEVKLIMIDPKVVELSVYNGIPHLMIPVVTDPRKASAALQWGVNEMMKRYDMFAEYHVRDMKGYNKRVTSGEFADVPEQERPKMLPQIVIIVDELADLMMVASKEVEESICRIAQLARAAGIHLVVATQRPSVNVITGIIKANMPSRIAFSVTSGVDSRTILDGVGAEKLLGKGDMLFYPQGYPKPARLQGAYVSDDEINDVVKFLIDNASEEDKESNSSIQAEIDSLSSAGKNQTQSGSSSMSQDGASDNGFDPLFEKAARFIMEKEKASVSMLQRQFKIGFNRAARIMDQLCEAGVVGEEEGTKPRKILMGPEQFEQYVEEYL